jgi:Zn-dependent protease
VFPPLELGRLFGIRIRASWSFVAVLAAVLFVAGQGGVLSSGWLTFVVLLAGVLLHEIGHALCAKRFGIQVLDITFWPLGGMARMSEVPESPRVEAWIALAGPLVNLAVALLTAPLLAYAGDGPFSGSQAGLWPRFLYSTLWIHLSLGLFNLVPAFPMDGGRVLRALLGLRFSWLQATEAAVKVSRFTTLALLLFGLLRAPQLGLVFLIVALFLWWEGFSELTQVRLRHAQEFFARATGAARGAAADSAFAPEGAVRAPGDRPASTPPPVAQAPAQSAGLFGAAALPGEPIGAGAAGGLANGARRPALWSLEPLLQRGRRHGFDPEVLRLLEAFPGPLRTRALEP